MRPTRRGELAKRKAHVQECIEGMPCRLVAAVWLTASAEFHAFAFPTAAPVNTGANQKPACPPLSQANANRKTAP